MEHKTILGVGGTVHYWISRPCGMPKGTIVFTHGLTANHTMFEKQVSYFTDKYTIILWDVPMHGLSRPYQNFSYCTRIFPLFPDLSLCFWLLQACFFLFFRYYH